MKIYRGIDELIGKTPLLELVNIEKEQGLFAKILVKIEKFNPAGSSKDRAGLFMIKDAEENGLIGAGGTLIEPTSGNTGIAMSAVGISRGYKVILTMPDTMSKERIALLKAYGAEVVLTDGALGMQGAINKAKEIQENTPNSIILGQFDNPANIKAHYLTTGPEIWADTDGKVDYFLAGVGTGGTLTGTGKFLKEQNELIKVVAVEPENSPMLSKGEFGVHKIQGIGANFVPENFDKNVCDEILTTTDEQAFFWTKELCRKEGLLVGISSGAVLSVAIEIAKRKENKDKVIVALLSDSGERYLSTGIYE